MDFNIVVLNNKSIEAINSGRLRGNSYKPIDYLIRNYNYGFVNLESL